MFATAFLASKKIPMILSDNGRRSLTLEAKERNRRQIEIFLCSGARTFLPEVIDEHSVR